MGRARSAGIHQARHALIRVRRYGGGNVEPYGVVAKR